MGASVNCMLDGPRKTTNGRDDSILPDSGGGTCGGGVVPHHGRNAAVAAQVIDPAYGRLQYYYE
jgi:hypothetical protein